MLLLTGCASTAQRVGPGPQASDHLPLHRLDAAAGCDQCNAVVIFYTGVAGWGPVDAAIGARLAARGYPVVGVDSFRYFWRSRTAEGAALDLTRLIEGEGRLRGRSRVILAGYSFGGAALPLIAERLPREVLDRVELLALIAPSIQGELVLRPWSFIDVPGPTARPIAPSVAALSGPAQICIYGVLDHLAACPGLDADHTRRVALPGGHLFVGQTARVAELVADAAQSLKP